MLRVFFFLLLPLLFLHATGVYTITQAVKEDDFTQHTQIFIDTNNTLPFSKIQTQNFIKFDKNKVNFAGTNSTFWFKIDFNNTTNLTQWFLQSEHRWPDYFDVYVEQENHLFSHFVGGEKVPLSKHTYQHEDPVFCITLPPHSVHTVYMRLKMMDFVAAFKISAVKPFTLRAHDTDLLKGILLGIVLALIIYNTILALTLRSKLYGYYVGYLVFIMLFISGDNGLLFAYIHPEFAFLNGVDKIVYVGVSTLFLMLFSTTFLETKKYNPILYKISIVYGISVAMTNGVFAINPGYDFFIFLNNVLLLAPIIIIANIVYAYKRKYTPVVMYAIGYSMFLLFAIFSLLNNIHTIDWPAMTRWGLSYGVAFEGVLFSYALFKRLHFDEEERKRFEEEAKRKDIFIQTQSRMASMGEMLGNITHQWKQPLATISATVSNMDISHQLESLSEEDFNASIESINEQIGLMQQTSKDFLNYYKPNKKQKVFDINKTVHLAVKFTKGSLIKNQIALEIIQSKEPVTIFGFPNELSQVLINIINNAKDALVENVEQSRAITITVAQREEQAYVTLEDNAGGIPLAIIDKIFDSYFSTKEDKGTGLGLHMSKQIVTEKMDGTIEVKNGKEGAIFTLSFPIAKEI